MAVFRTALLVSSTCLLLAACGRETSAPVDPPATAAAAAAPVPAPALSTDTEALRQQASTALAANRLFAPAGDNAIEAYLQLRQWATGPDPVIETALSDLAPYVVIGIEQAIAEGAFAEADRLLGLIARMDAEAPALPRLHESLRLAREAEAARQVEAATGNEGPTRATPMERPALVPPPAPARPAAAIEAPVALAPAAAIPAPSPAAVPAQASPRATAPTQRALLNQVPARFPDQALRRRLEGSVQLQLTIAASGEVTGVEVIESSHEVFHREALLAVRRWRYEPAAIASTQRVIVHFRLPP